MPAETGLPGQDANAPVAGPGPSAARLRRWRAAQRYELDWWGARGPADLRAQDARFADTAGALAGLLDAHARSDWRRAALQVGTAGVAEIHHLPVRARYAVEPLARSLSTRGLLVRRDVRFVCAMGERLPFGNERFSLALAPNVIDHVADPDLLLAELHRCLEPGALLWLSSHVSPGWAIPAFRLLGHSGLGYFAGHPWYFTPERLRVRAEQSGFAVRLEQTEAVAAPGATPHPSARTRLKRRLLSVRYLLLARI